MAYADALRATTADFADAATLIEGQLLSASTAASYEGMTLALTTASASFGALGVVSIALTVPASAKVLLWGAAQVSAGTTNAVLQVGISEDSTSTLSGTFWSILREPSGNTSGYSTTLPVYKLLSPSTGAHTYRLLWACSTGTGYCNGAELHGIVLRA
jgi:hypothetical protein